MKLTPAKRINGKLSLPGDKSISHRVAMICALASGVSEIANFSSALDCASTLNCLQQLGISIEQSADKGIIEGRNEFTEPTAALDCGNSGSTMRILAGVLASTGFNTELIGDESLSSRPMQRIIQPLELMGARIKSVSGKPPLRITGSDHPSPISYKLPVASAQVKSAVLFCGLKANGRTEVIETVKSRDHTERLFNGFGVAVNDAGLSVQLDGPARFRGGNIIVPGDISSAAYFIAGAALLPGSELIINGVGLNPTRSSFLTVLNSWGANIKISDVHSERNETVGTVTVLGGISTGASQADRTIDKDLIPSLIDELPLLAVVGTQVSGGIEIRDAAELRHKESDRLSATARNLIAMGAELEEKDDGLIIGGPAKLKGARLDSFGDHRIAMSFAIAGLLADGPSELDGPECVEISFPEFFSILQRVTK